MNDYEKQVFRSAISKYGDSNQIIVAIEEMSELIKALCKKLRGRPDFENIAEEMADVGIMLDQLMIMHDCSFKVGEIKAAKVARLRDGLEGS